MMRLLWFAVGLIAVMQAKMFSMKIRSTGSLREKLIANGQYHEFLELEQKRRVAAESNGDSSQTFFDYFDNLYVATVAVGTPGQAMELVLDTGSSNVWVIDSSCASLACKRHDVPKHKFYTKNSSTFQADGRTFAIRYGSGSCSGYLGTDVVSFAGLKINKQGIGVATQIADVFANQPIDGIFGMGWPALAVQHVMPPMQNVLRELDEPVFNVWLERLVKPAHGERGGQITYGEFDFEHCDRRITYVPLSSETYWQFTLDGFSVGSGSRKKKEQAISDTGTSWIAMPRAALAVILMHTGATYDYRYGLYSVPCGKMRSLPDLVITISGVQFSVPSVEYVLDLGLGETCAVTFFAMDSIGFMPSWILGDTWIRSYCNLYDIGRKRIGFAKAMHHL